MSTSSIAVQRDYTIERNLDFLAECRRQYRLMTSGNAPLPMTDDVIRRAVMARAPGYYIGFDHAFKFVGRCLRHPEQFEGNSSPRRALIFELAQRCRDVMNEFPSLTLGEALARVLNTGTASSYFISFATARRIYYENVKSAHRYSDRLRKRKLF